MFRCYYNLFVYDTTTYSLTTFMSHIWLLAPDHDSGVVCVATDENNEQNE